MKNLLLLFALLAIIGIAQAEMLDNGGFEDSETDKAPWVSWGSGGSIIPDKGYVSTWGSAIFDSVLNTSGGAYDAGGGDNWLDIGCEGTQTQTWAGWGYNVAFQGKIPDGQPGITVTQGASMTMSADFKSPDVTSVMLGFEWCDNAGYMIDVNGDGQINDWDKQNIMLPFVADDTWRTVSVTVTVPTIAGLTNLIAVFGGAGGHQALGLDNASLIPEPMSIALLGLGGLFLRRRK